MTDRDLAHALEQLREEVAELGEDRSGSRERLEGLIAELEHRLAEPDDTDAHAGLADSVADAIRHFELENPRTTGILNHIMVVLGGMGI